MLEAEQPKPQRDTIVSVDDDKQTRASTDLSQLEQEQLELVSKRIQNRARILLYHLRGNIKLDDVGRLILANGDQGPFLYSVLRYCAGRKGYRPRPPDGISEVSAVLKGTEFELENEPAVRPSEKTAWKAIY